MPQIELRVRYLPQEIPEWNNIMFIWHTRCSLRHIAETGVQGFTVLLDLIYHLKWLSQNCFHENVPLIWSCRILKSAFSVGIHLRGNRFLDFQYLQKTFRTTVEIAFFLIFMSSCFRAKKEKKPLPINRAHPFFLHLFEGKTWGYHVFNSYYNRLWKFSITVITVSPTTIFTLT
jgi:hypothetical protein